MIEVLNIIFILLVGIITVYIIRHYLFTVTALYPKSNQQSFEYSKTVYEPKVSVLIPARNEEKVIDRILQRMTELTYPKNKFEVLVIDDASTDQTGKNAKRFAKYYDFIHFIQRSQKEGGKGKPEVLNCALKYVTGEIIYCFDADYYPQRNVIEKLNESFKDPKVGAVQGRVTVLNERDSLITRLVTLERTGGYRVDQFARNELNLIPQYGGTVGGFRKDLIEQLGGWAPNVLAEDTDITFRIYLAGFTVKYINYADCYEEAVSTWRSYWRQRLRWATGRMVVPLFFYSSVGNFAPFFEVGIGAYLDGRDRICWLIPLLFLTFVFNVLICSKAFVNLCIGKIFGKKAQIWEKTVHSGNKAINIV
ncbi:MAG: glycosyltransferase family 2 protein [Candidatus Bathyarchaeota archaeon]